MSIESSGKASRTEGMVPGLDGLRALSVLAVLMFHAHFGWMAGGFLGVEVFFVISGFLITGLLLKEFRQGGGIGLRRFYARRMRRLLPALLAVLFCIGAYGMAFLGTRASQFRADLLASFLYLENWYQIGSKSSYFADQGLPLLRHLWSLAVEGQFYMVWPLLVAGVLWVSRGRVLPLFILTGALGAASLGLMLRLADPGNLSSMKAMESLDRVYLGTDTRALGLLVGALLAMVLPARRAGRLLGGTLDAAAGLGLGALGLIMAWIDYQTPFLCRGGFLLVDGLTALVITALVSGRAVAAILEWRPLKWLGERSYGLYLWHWPVFRLLAPGDGSMPWFLMRLLVAGLITEASYRYLEQPIRQGALKRWSAGAASRTPLRLAGAVVVLAMAWETTALAARAPYVDPVQASIQAGAAALDDLRPVLPPRTREGVSPPVADSPAEPGRKAVELPPELKGVRLTAIGDLVMKGAAISLKKMGEVSLGPGMIQINAEECRSFIAAQAILRDYRQEKRLGEVVVVHLGTNNSSISQDQFRRLMASLADRRLVLFLTAKSDKVQACETVNKTLEALVAEFPNARVCDWKTAADLHPDYFYSDQTHLRPVGAQFYAEMILNQVWVPAGQEQPGRTAAARVQ